MLKQGIRPAECYKFQHSWCKGLALVIAWLLFAIAVVPWCSSAEVLPLVVGGALALPPSDFEDLLVTCVPDVRNAAEKTANKVYSAEHFLVEMITPLLLSSSSSSSS
jgi:hypothetical protein